MYIAYRMLCKVLIEGYSRLVGFRVVQIKEMAMLLGTLLPSDIDRVNALAIQTWFVSMGASTKGTNYLVLCLT